MTQGVDVLGMTQVSMLPCGGVVVRSSGVHLCP